MLKSYFKQDIVAPTQHYLVLIRFRRNISFVTSFKFLSDSKKYYSCSNENFLNLLFENQSQNIQSIENLIEI